MSEWNIHLVINKLDIVLSIKIRSLPAELQALLNAYIDLCYLPHIDAFGWHANRFESVIDIT